MAWQDYLNIETAGLAANLPTTVDNPTVSRSYFCTDTGETYMWNVVGQSWQLDSGAPALIAAAGQTIASATVIKTKKAIITAFATATHNGVRLPTAFTGREVEVVSGISSAGGFKVYPSAGAKISTAAVSAADSTTLKGMKTNVYLAVSTTKWAVQRGA